MKSILEDLQVVKLLPFDTLGVMDFVDFQNISHHKMQKFRVSKCDIFPVKSTFRSTKEATIALISRFFGA